MVNLSRAEAKQAWLAEGSDLERAARQALRERLAKVRGASKDHPHGPYLRPTYLEKTVQTDSKNSHTSSKTAGAATNEATV